MRKNKIINLIIFSLIFFLLINCFPRKSAQIKVLVTTSLIETIVANIGHERIEVISIIPSGMCPGHFDLKPHHVQLASSSQVLFFHGWEKWINELKKSVNNKNLKIVSLETEGNLMIPDNYLEAINKVTNVLCEIAPANSKYFQNNAHIYIKRIKTKVYELKKNTKLIENIPVLCSQYQAEFLKWMGLKVVESYGRPDELTIKQLIRLIKIGKQEGVKAVIDNLQSGEKAGEEVAREIGCKHLTLTNFPLNYSYLDTLDYNVNKLMEIVK